MPVSAADSPQALVCCNHTPCFPKLLQRGLTCQHKQAIVTVVQQAMVTMLLQLATLFFHLLLLYIHVLLHTSHRLTSDCLLGLSH